MSDETKPMGVVEMCETLQALARPDLAERVDHLGRELRRVRSDHYDCDDSITEFERDLAEARSQLSTVTRERDRYREALESLVDRAGYSTTDFGMAADVKRIARRALQEKP